MSAPILGYDYQTIDMIVNFADSHDLPPVMLLASGLQESRLDVNESTGDRGQSFGCFQIYTNPAAGHGGPPERWLSYTGLANSMVEMGEKLWVDGESRWHHYFGVYGGWARWKVDAVRMFVDGLGEDMQGSIPWTVEQAHTQVNLANAIYALYLRTLIVAPVPVPEPHPEPQPEPPPVPAWPDPREAIDGLTLSAISLDAEALAAENAGRRLRLQAAGARAVVARYSG